MEEFRICTNCGKRMVEGYVIGDDYACSDECRNAIYKRDCGAKDDNDAYRMYLKDCYELSEREAEGKTSEELEKMCQGRDIGDVAYWTEW